MKLYFGNAVTTATTLMILALLECLRIIGGETENLGYGADRRAALKRSRAIFASRRTP